MDNILDSDCEALVNPVNCVGVMGAGLALQFQQKWPTMAAAHAHACKMDIIRLGKMWVYPVVEGKKIINFPTKLHWRHRSQFTWIVDGLQDLTSILDWYEIQSIAIPPLGCGLGGLDWPLVEQAIHNALGDLNVRVDIYPPGGRRYTL